MTSATLDAVVTETNWSDRVPQIIREAFPDMPLVEMQQPVVDPFATFASVLSSHEYREFARYFKIGEDPWLETEDFARDIRRCIREKSELLLLRLAMEGPAAWSGNDVPSELSVYGKGQNWYELSQSCVREKMNISKNLTDVDASLLLAVTSRVTAPIPFGLAMSLTKQTQQRHDLFCLSTTARDNAIVNSPQLLDPDAYDVRLDDDTVSLTVPARLGEYGQEPIAELFRRREGDGRSNDTRSVACLLPGDGKTMLASTRLASSTDWSRNTAAYGYNIKTICDFKEEIRNIIAMARSGHTIPNTPAGAIVRGILAVYEPLTGNLPGLTEESPERQWASAVCLDKANELAELASLPHYQEPFGAVAKLLAILNKRRRGFVPDAHIRPAGVRHAWHFKLRTSDHTWVTGVIYRTEAPCNTARSQRLELPDSSHSAGNGYYGDSGWSAWFGSPSLRCRVKESRT